MMELLSLDGIAEDWAAWRDALNQGLFDDAHQNIDTEGDRVLQRWWHEGWIPIASDGAGNFDCVDINPGKNGVFGQVIDLDHETIERSVIASSISGWLHEHIDELEAGDYIVFDGELVERQDAEVTIRMNHEV